MNNFTIALHFRFEDGERAFNLDKRIINVLKENGITHLGYLVGFDFEVFKKFRNFGIKSISQLENFLKQIGFESDVEVNSWFHDELLEAEAFDIVSHAILNSKKISEFLPLEAKNIIEAKKKIKHRNRKKKEKHFEDLKAQFLENYSLNDFVLTFKECFKIDNEGLSRDGEMIKLRYLNGYKLQTIGDKYGVTRERIRQIIEKKLRKLKRYAVLRNIFLKEFLEKEKKNIWLTLVQDQENKNILLKKELKNNLLTYKKSNRNGLYDILIKMYFGTLINYINEHYVVTHEHIMFNDVLIIDKNA